MPCFRDKSERRLFSGIPILSPLDQYIHTKTFRPKTARSIEKGTLSILQKPDSEETLLWGSSGRWRNAEKQIFQSCQTCIRELQESKILKYAIFGQISVNNETNNAISCHFSQAQSFHKESAIFKQKLSFLTYSLYIWRHLYNFSLIEISQSPIYQEEFF